MTRGTQTIPGVLTQDIGRKKSTNEVLVKDNSFEDKGRSRNIIVFYVLGVSS